jgi:hypothetical protein
VAEARAARATDATEPTATTVELSAVEQAGQAIQRLEKLLHGARADAEQADTDLAEASYAVHAAEGDERASDASLVAARRAKQSVTERINSLQAAVQIARAKLTAAQADAAAKLRAEQAAAFSAHLDQRQDVAGRLAHHLEGAAEAFHDLHRLNMAALQACPGGFQQGAVLLPAELRRATSYELHRISTDPSFLGRGGAPEDRMPALPGAEAPRFDLILRPDHVVPLVEEIATANRYLISKLNPAPMAVAAE